MDKKTPDDLNETPVCSGSRGNPAICEVDGGIRPSAVIGLAVAIVVLLGISVWKNQKKRKGGCRSPGPVPRHQP